MKPPKINMLPEVDFDWEGSNVASDPIARGIIRLEHRWRTFGAEKRRDRRTPTGEKFTSFTGAISFSEFSKSSVITRIDEFFGRIERHFERENANARLYWGVSPYLWLDTKRDKIWLEASVLVSSAPIIYGYHPESYSAPDEGPVMNELRSRFGVIDNDNDALES